MSALTEFGAEFPVSFNIKGIFEKARQFKPLRSLIRNLTSVLFLYDDDSILIIPVRVLQSSKSCSDITSYLENQTQAVPEGIFTKSFGKKVYDLVTLDSKQSTYLVGLEGGDLLKIALQENGEFFTSVSNLQLNVEGLVSLQIRLPYLIAFTKNGEKYSIYVSKYSETKKWGYQCVVDKEMQCYVVPPSLYLYDDNKIYGCSLDETGYRKFPRDPILIYESESLKPVKSLDMLNFFDSSKSELLTLTGKTIKNRKFDDSANGAQQYVLLGPVLFALFNDKISSFNYVAGDPRASQTVGECEEWHTSLEESYGAVFAADRQSAFCVSRTELPPLIDLNADRAGLLRQMRQAEAAAGTVAVPVMLLSSRSCFLAATLMADDIERELQGVPAPGSIQEHLRPALLRLSEILAQKP